MGRIKVELEKKKDRLSVTITEQNFKDLEGSRSFSNHHRNRVYYCIYS